MGSLLIVTGPPGAGKSTVAAVLAAQTEPSVLVDGDRFFAFIARGAVTPWLPGSEHQNETVTRAAGAATGRFVAGGFDTIYDGIVGPWFLPTFAAAAGLVRLDYAVLLPSADTCVRNVLGRSGHGFRDEEATRKMHAEFEQADVDDRHVLRIEGEPVDDVAARVRDARASGGLALDVG
jgi:hypothetical protein